MLMCAVIGLLISLVGIASGADIFEKTTTHSVWPFNVAETTTIIGVVMTGIVGIINAIKTHSVHHLVNRNFSEQKQEIADLRAALLIEQNIARRNLRPPQEELPK